jgi:hypothetical protein
MPHENGQSPLAKERRQELAAELLADGATWKQVQAETGVRENALWLWTKDPAFVARVDAAQKRRVEALALRGIAARAGQLEALQADWDRLELLLHARGNDPLIRQAAGGASGYIVRKSRAQPTGPSTVKEVYDDSFDSALLFSRLKLLEYASRVAGWSQPTAPDVEAIRAETRRMAEKAGLSDEDTQRALEAAERLVRERHP